MNNLLKQILGLENINDENIIIVNRDLSFILKDLYRVFGVVNIFSDVKTENEDYIIVKIYTNLEVRELTIIYNERNKNYE